MDEGVRVKRRRVLAVLVVVAFVALIIAVFLLITGGPATGQIKQSGQPTQDPNAKQAITKTYTGKYLSFMYPASYTTEPSPVDNAHIYLEMANFAAHGAAGELSVTVQPSVPLASLSGMHLRQSEPSVYQQAPITTDGNTGYIFSSTANGFEKTAFIAHGDIVVTIALSTPNNSDLTDDFNQILSSLQWSQ
jgi:hypothetical protein